MVGVRIAVPPTPIGARRLLGIRDPSCDARRIGRFGRWTRPVLAPGRICEANIYHLDILALIASVLQTERLAATRPSKEMSVGRPSADREWSTDGRASLWLRAARERRCRRRHWSPWLRGDLSLVASVGSRRDGSGWVTFSSALRIFNSRDARALDTPCPSSRIRSANRSLDTVCPLAASALRAARAAGIRCATSRTSSAPPPRTAGPDSAVPGPVLVPGGPASAGTVRDRPLIVPDRPVIILVMIEHGEQHLDRHQERDRRPPGQRPADRIVTADRDLRGEAGRCADHQRHPG
jgi:hypothetical protein